RISPYNELAGWKRSFVVLRVHYMLYALEKSVKAATVSLHGEDTNLIATWLAVTAKRCGYPVDLISNNDTANNTFDTSQPAGRLKGKARKLAKATAGAQISETKDDIPTESRPTHTIKVQDFINLAQYITGKRKPRVPRVLVQSLRRAIALRRKHGLYSQSQGDQSDSDKSHTHFLGILEYTLEILKPHAPSPVDQPVVDNETKPGVDQSDEFQNKFSKLELQETSDSFQQFLDAPDVDQSVKTEIEQGPRYEAELFKDKREEYTAAHFLFQDIMYFFTFAQGGWRGYKEGRDLSAVSISINTMITFVRDLEEEFQAQFPAKADYLDKAELFYLSQCRGRNISQDFREDAEGYKLADDVMLTTYLLVCGLQGDGYAGCLQDPGRRNESVPWLQKSPDEKYLDNRSRLREAYPLLDMISGLTKPGRMPEDELIRGVREMRPGKPIPVWLVFAFHCFLNSQHTLGEAVDQPFFHLKGLCDTVRGSITDLKEFHRSLSMTCWPKQESQLQEILDIIDAWMAKDWVEEGVREVSFNALRQYRC
ncbi:MAG: hypothetical protein L6R42_009371, partial [Xanthoria sp. 1 TBL-2021]